MISKILRKIFGSGEIEIRVRIAPSPTGPLHLGTARTALFNWLFAKKYNGKFILRIEDTDLERSDKKYEKDIIDGLKWLGLDWDEDPSRQSERLDVYEKHIKKLLAQDNAYYCSCSKEELEKERQTQLEKGKSPRYNGKCRDRKISSENGQLIRFKTIEDNSLSFQDLIRGEITFKTSLIGDFGIAKDTRTPLYNLAVVIDDEELKISHIIRGEDHIANTPKQTLLQQALGFKTPKYAHLPLILDPDRGKLSKRYSVTSVQEYQAQGYLSEAMVNFMALLGWHPTGAEEIEKMPILKIIEKFSLDRVQKGGAVFDIRKLDWLNSHYIREKSSQDLLELLQKFYGKELQGDPKTLLKMMEIGKPRMNKLSDFKKLQASFNLSDYDKNLLVWKNTPENKTLENLKKTREIVRGIMEHEFNQKKLETYLMPHANTGGRGEVLWPLRVSLSGTDKSPGPFEIMYIIGKEETLKRMEIAIQKLESGS